MFPRATVLTNDCIALIRLCEYGVLCITVEYLCLLFNPCLQTYQLQRPSSRTRTLIQKLILVVYPNTKTTNLGWAYVPFGGAIAICNACVGEVKVSVRGFDNEKTNLSSRTADETATKAL